MLSITELLLKDEERTPCEVWTRVMGYHRPVSAFNPGKQGEHEERQQFVERLVSLKYYNGSQSVNNC